MQALPFYLAGKWTYPYVRRVTDNTWVLCAGVGCLMLFLSGCVSFYITPTGGHSYSPFYLLAWVCTLLLFPLVFRTMTFIRQPRGLCAIGRHSLGIMLTHAPMCHTAAVVLNRVFEKGSTPWIICFLLAYACIVALSYALTLAIERYCPLLLGKKQRARQ